MSAPTEAAADAVPQRFGLVACRVFEAEIALHGGCAPHIVVTRFLEVGLHDHRTDSARRSRRKSTPLIFGMTFRQCCWRMGFVGGATAGLRAGRHQLVIPRAHDCITVFMGSKEKYACQQAAQPDSYYYTPGWMHANRTPGPERIEALREELSRKFAADDVEFLLETERANWARHGRAVYLDLGTPDADEKAATAAAAARALHWQYQRLPGDPVLLRDLLAGRWYPERFQIIKPGEVLDHTADERIFRKGMDEQNKDGALA